MIDLKKTAVATAVSSTFFVSGMAVGATWDEVCGYYLDVDTLVQDEDTRSSSCYISLADGVTLTIKDSVLALDNDSSFLAFGIDGEGTSNAVNIVDSDFAIDGEGSSFRVNIYDGDVTIHRDSNIDLNSTFNNGFFSVRGRNVTIKDTMIEVENTNTEMRISSNGGDVLVKDNLLRFEALRVSSNLGRVSFKGNRDVGNLRDLFIRTTSGDAVVKDNDLTDADVHFAVGQDLVAKDNDFADVYGFVDGNCSEKNNDPDICPIVTGP